MLGFKPGFKPGFKLCQGLSCLRIHHTCGLMRSPGTCMWAHALASCFLDLSTHAAIRVTIFTPNAERGSKDMLHDSF